MVALTGHVMGAPLGPPPPTGPALGALLREQRANELPDAGMRERFLGQVQEHARVRELDRLWSA